ncbi:oxygenase MpaB family protein [Azotobacter chroococcum]
MTRHPSSTTPRAEPPAGGSARRFDRLREIEGLDPERDCQRIVHLSFGYEFCWDSTKALEFALYRTYCVPGISRLLERTGEFLRHAQRRFDDTALLIAEVCEWGYESGRGREALERINWAHGHYRIANHEFLYVLSTLLYEPIRWIDRYGWRPTCRNERLGYYHFWRGVGILMGIRDIPPSYEAFEAWARAYEDEAFRYHEANRRVGAATRDLFASWYPALSLLWYVRRSTPCSTTPCSRRSAFRARCRACADWSTARSGCGADPAPAAAPARAVLLHPPAQPDAPAGLRHRRARPGTTDRGGPGAPGRRPGAPGLTSRQTWPRQVFAGQPAQNRCLANIALPEELRRRRTSPPGPAASWPAPRRAARRGRRRSGPAPG